MKILAIDTSCDDTSIAILQAEKSKFEILSNIVSSQEKLHQKYGGVYPSLAKREHQKNLPIVLKKALQGAKLPASEIDFIAVTIGPGLEPCLWQGINFAQELAKKWGLPIIPVNHIEAHLVAGLLTQPSSNFQKTLPAIALVVSGGHTQLILIKNIGNYKIIGETRDDAAGECFDKTARILGLPYPGGPAIAAQAQKSMFDVEHRTLVKLPRPMLYTKDYDFSFSGLKTAVLYNWKKQPKKISQSKKYISAMAQEIQQSIIDVLIKKTLKAVRDFKVKTIILGGGVSANQELRKQFQVKIEAINSKIDFLTPSKNLSTDNAVMIAMAGWFNQQKATKKIKQLEAMANSRIS